MEQKTYDRQSGKLIARIAENLPEMSGELMQGWIDDPRGLQKFLQGLCYIWTVVSNGRNAQALIGALEAKGRRVSNWAKDAMSKAGFKVTKGQTYNFVVIRGDEFATDAERTTANIFAEGVRRRYRKPPADAAALLREKFTQEELGFPYVVVMHEPITGSGGDSFLLVLARRGDGEWLRAWLADPDEQWHRGSVFVFLTPQD